MESIIAYNGFDKDLKIMGRQYAFDKAFDFDNDEYYESGFRSELNPLKVLESYDPANCKFCEVEHSGDVVKEDNGGVVSKNIFIKREISLRELVNIATHYINKNVNFEAVKFSNLDYDVKTCLDNKSIVSGTGYRSVSANVGDESIVLHLANYSISANTGNWSVVTNNGEYSLSMSTGFSSIALCDGDNSVVSTTGGRSNAINTGQYSVSAATGYNSQAENIGNHSVSVTTSCESKVNAKGFYSIATSTGSASTVTTKGGFSSAINTGSFSNSITDGKSSISANTGKLSVAKSIGKRSVAVNTGDESVSGVEGSDSIAVVTGRYGKAAGALGCWLVLSEIGNNDEILDVQTVKVDGINIKPNVYYQLIKGKVVKTNY